MLDLQKEFLEFHDNIKLDDENDILRQKRDILLGKLKSKITDDATSYKTFNQGSYAMGTGIYPDDGDYDIDVGLKFEIDKDDYPDPVTVKKWVYDALDGHTKKVEIRRSCVTVTYQENNEAQYHIDFAVYAASNSDGRMYIAKGKEYSASSEKKWEVSCPQELIDTLRDRFTGDDRLQFRRIIRYMKKWKDHQFASGGNSAPTGIALTVLAYNHFSVNSSFDPVSCKEKYNDLAAISDFVTSVLNCFSLDYKDGDWYHTISVNLPVDPYNDLFSKMTVKQTEEFYQKLRKMSNELDKVKDSTKRSDACSVLVGLFGDDFPVTTDRSTVGTSESA